MRIRISADGGVTTANADGTRMVQPRTILVKITSPQGEVFEKRQLALSELAWPLRTYWYEGDNMVTRIG